MCEGSRYDLMLDLEPAVLRVQCKMARSLPGALLVALRTSRCTPRGYVATTYTAEEVDVIATYSPELRRAFLLPINEVEDRSAVHLRLEPTANNQAHGIKWASAYEFASMIQHLHSDPIET